MAAISKQNIGAQFFDENFRSNFSSREDFHIVSITVGDDMLALYFSGTAKTVPMANRADEEYDSSRTVDGDETKRLLVHCAHYRM